MLGICIRKAYVGHQSRLDYVAALVLIQVLKFLLKIDAVVFSHAEHPLLDEGSQVIEQADHHHEAQEHLHLLVRKVKVSLFRLQFESGLEVGVGIVEAQGSSKDQLDSFSYSDVPYLSEVIEVADVHAFRVSQENKLIALM